MVMEKTPESNQSIKGSLSSVLVGRTNAEEEAPVYWSSDVKS